MNRWARIGLLAVVLLVCGIVWGALHSWDDSQALKTPPKVPAAEATYRCAAVLRADRPPVRIDHQPASYALARPPCDTRSSQRNYVIFDLIFIGSAVAFGLAVIRRSDQEPSVAPAV
jgi:hypothetical protein